MSKKNRDGTFAPAPTDDGAADLTDDQIGAMNDEALSGALGTDTPPAPADTLVVFANAEPSALIQIVPKLTKPKVRVGSEWMSFTKGVKKSIKREMLAHLRRIGVV